MPSQPSPSRPARLIAASERPPMMIGIGAAGAGSDDRLVEVEERAVEGDRAPGQELAHDGEAFVHPRAPGRRVHPADRDLVAVLAAHPDPEDEPPGGEPGDVRELAGHQDGMAQRQQVHAAVDGQRGVEHRQRGGLDEPVEPHAGEEAHMVAAADMVDARLGGLRQECPRGSGPRPSRSNGGNMPTRGDAGARSPAARPVAGPVTAVLFMPGSLPGRCPWARQRRRRADRVAEHARNRRYPGRVAEDDGAAAPRRAGRCRAVWGRVGCLVLAMP